MKLTITPSIGIAERTRYRLTCLHEGCWRTPEYGNDLATLKCVGQIHADREGHTVEIEDTMAEAEAR